MKLTKKQKVFTGIAILCFILIITNPSITAFKARVGKNTYSGLYRTANFFVLSTYKCYGKKYIGFFGNFFEEKPNVVYVQVAAQDIDSTKKDTVGKIDYASFDNALKASTKTK